QSILRNRLDPLDAGQAGHRGLNRERQELLHLHWRQARRPRQHQNLVRRDVRHRVYRQLLQGINANRGCQDHPHYHDPPVAKSSINDPVHGYSSPRSLPVSTDLRWNAPAVTTGSPFASPWLISTRSRTLFPAVTQRGSNSVGVFRINTTVLSPT